MAKMSIVAFACLALLLLVGVAPAQDEEEPGFNLIVGDQLDEEITEELAEEAKYIPAIEKGAWDLTLTMGYFNMTQTLMRHDRLIYKATDEELFYADVKLVNQAAFNPMLRIGYTITKWLGVEAQAGITFSNYIAELTNPYSVAPEAGSDPKPVDDPGEFDAENRSSTIFIGNLNLVWYPLNMAGDGVGRWHPYVTGGAGYVSYSLDSNYIQDPASGINGNIGVGVKLIADDLISVRAEVLYQYHHLKFEPSRYFEQQQGGTVEIPIYEFDENGNFSEVQGFESQDLGGLTWQIGASIAL